MKTMIIIFSILLAIAITVFCVLQHPAFGCKQSDEHQFRILNSPNYHDGMFHNQQPTVQLTGRINPLKIFWRMFTDTDSNRIPHEALTAVKTDLLALPSDTDCLVWFGHSSYLFQINGKRFLVDPVLTCEFPASFMLRPFKGTDIYHPEDMPQIDCLILTHEHWDHLDYGTLRKLKAKTRHIVCPLGIAQYLEYWVMTRM